MNRTLRIVFAAVASFVLLVSCPNPLMDAVKAKVARDEGNRITAFGFAMAANAKLYRDITGVVNETAHTITLTVPKWVPLTGLVATYDFLGATVTVNGAVQTSDVTANDFSSPLTYTVTPAVGTPVEYTVTAASSAQGLRGGSIQGVPLSLSGIVDTLAGQASIFGDPAGCVVVGSPSYIYVADYAYHVIWRIQNFNPYAAEVFAGALSEPGFNDGTGTSARFSNPQGMATDGTYLYVADFSNGAIRKIAIGTGDVVPFVSGLDGPTGIYYYALGNILYETDAGTGAVRSISMGGTVTTLLTNQPTGNEWPVDIVRYNDKLYVTDQNLNSIWQIDAITPSTVTIFAGTNDINGGYLDGTGTGAKFFYPSALALGGSDNLYVADYGNNVIRRITLSSASVDTYLGKHDEPGTQDGVLSAVRLYGPQGICAGSTMIITESGNKLVRRIVGPSSSTVAGTPPGSTNGVGSTARFNVPRQLSTDGSSEWIIDGFNHVIRSLDPTTSTVSTLAGVVQAGQDPDEGNGSAMNALFSYPSGITQVGSALFICDNVGQTIRKLDLVTGQVTTFAGKVFWAGSSDGTGTGAEFYGPTSITNDGTYLYVTDYSNYTIRKIEISTAAVTTFAGLPGVYGNVDGVGSSARFRFPFGITTDGTSLFVTDRSNHRIRKIDITTAAVSTLAGSSAGYLNGTGTAAKFRFPRGITTDGTYLYIADSSNHVIRRIEIATAIVDTVAGSDPSLVKAGEIDGTGTAARFNMPNGITTDGTSLYVSDIGGNTIRRIR